MQRCSNRRSVAAKPQWQSQRCNTRKRAERARTERPNRVRARAAGRPSHGAHGRGDPQRAGAHAQQARSHCFRSSCCSPTLRGRSGQQGGRHAPPCAAPARATAAAAVAAAGPRVPALRVAGCCVAARRARWQLRVGAQRRTLRRLRACGAMDPGAHALARGGNQPVLQDMCARGVVGPAHGARARAAARGEAAGAGRGPFRGGRVGAAASHACAPAPEHLHA